MITTMNPWFFPMLALAVVLYIAGVRLMRRLNGPVRRGIALAGAMVLALPAVLFAVYYLHFFDHARWFFEFRTLPGSELTAAGAGLLAGMLQGLIRRKAIVFTVALPFTLVGLAGVLAIPYAKMLLLHDSFTQYQDAWSEGVCLQSASSCGPASAATLVRAAGGRITERELAQASFTSLTGTEVWYLARALTQRGYDVGYVFTPPAPENLPYPAMAGTRLNSENGPGHFIAILGVEGDNYVIGDPQTGRRLIPRGTINLGHYHFTGFFLTVRRNSRQRIGP